MEHLVGDGVVPVLLGPQRGTCGHEQRGDRADADRPAGTVGLRDPPDHGRADRRGPEEHHHVERHDPAAHLRLGRHLDGRVRGREHGQAREPDGDAHQRVRPVGRHDRHQTCRDTEGEGRADDQPHAGTLAAGSEERTRQGPDREDGPEDPVLPRSLAELCRRHDGRGQLEVQAEGRHDADHAHDDDDVAAVAHVPDALADLPLGPWGHRQPVELAHAHPGHRDDHRGEGQPVDDEHPPRAEGRDEQTGRTRSDEARGVEACGVEAHGVGELLLGHHLGDEGLTHRVVDRRDTAEERREDVHVPELGVT